MRKIIHIDMDCFFAAVEVKHNDLLLKQPVAVGGKADRRGVIAAASYEARKFGVRSAMSTAYALKLCPKLIIVPPKFNLYKEESAAIREIFERFTSKIEPLSLDEAYLDVTDNTDCGGSATLLAKKIRQTILIERGLVASAGIANNKFLAKICSDIKKPNGQFTIAPRDNDAFTKILPVGKIWGVGKKTEERMHKLGIKTCSDLRNLSLLELQKNFGSMGDSLHGYCRGIDLREVRSNSVRKSFSTERTFASDLQTRADICKAFEKVYTSFVTSFEKSKHKDSKIKGAHFKLKNSDFQSRSKDVGSIKKIPDFDTALSHLISFWESDPKDIRLIGFGVKLEIEDTSQLEFSL